MTQSNSYKALQKKMTDWNTVILNIIKSKFHFLKVLTNLAMLTISKKIKLHIIYEYLYLYLNIYPMTLWKLMQLDIWCMVTHCWDQWTKECSTGSSCFCEMWALYVSGSTYDHLWRFILQLFSFPNNNFTC